MTRRLFDSLITKVFPLSVSRPLELFSPLSPPECVSRLLAAIDPERSIIASFASLSGSRPVLGRVEGSTIRLRKRISGNNSFQTFVKATVHAHGSGTLIQGSLGMHSLFRAFIPIWFGGAMLLGGLLCIMMFFSILSPSSSNQHGDWLAFVAFPLMLVIGYAIVGTGLYLARDEAQFLYDFLCHTLDARESSKIRTTITPSA